MHIVGGFGGVNLNGSRDRKGELAIGHGFGDVLLVVVVSAKDLWKGGKWRSRGWLVFGWDYGASGSIAVDKVSFLLSRALLHPGERLPDRPGVVGFVWFAVSLEEGYGLLAEFSGRVPAVKDAPPSEIFVGRNYFEGVEELERKRSATCSGRVFEMA